MIKLNLTNIKPLAIIGTITITLAIFGLLILVFLKLKYSLSPSPSPTTKIYQPQIPDLSNVQPLSQPHNFQNELNKIQTLLPYFGNGYSIVYVQPTNIIDIKVKANDSAQYVQNKKTAESFLQSKGVVDLCALNIFWLPVGVPSKTIDAKDFITTGCPALPDLEP